MGFGALAGEDRGDAGFEDARFFACDGFDGVAEVNLVIEIDGRDNGERGVEHIRRVEAAAEASFNDRGLDAHFAKEPKTHGGDGFEISRMRLASDFVNGVEGSLKLEPCHGHAVDDDALGGFYQVRRRKESGADARGAESGVDHGAGRPFPVGSRDVDEAEGILRIVECGEDGADAVEPELGGFNFVAERIEEPHGVGVSEHAAVLLLSPVYSKVRPWPKRIASTGTSKRLSVLPPPGTRLSTN